MGEGRTYRAGCYRCGWQVSATGMADARALADEHDVEHHRGKPVSWFGWKRCEAGE